MSYGVALLDVARSAMAIADIGSDLGIEIVSQFVFHRYVELIGRTRMRQMRRVATIDYPQPLTAGSAVVTLGSNEVQGTGTAWTRQQVGWWFRFATNWYQVSDVDPVGQVLYLQSAYAESTVSNPTSSYYLVSRYLKLEKDTRWIGEVVHPRLFRRLLPRTLDWLDTRHPSRIVVGAIPTFWAEGPHYKGNTPPDLDERKQIEIYPSSTQPEMFQYSYWAVPSRMDPTDTLPPEIDVYALREGALIDIYRRTALQLARRGQEASLGSLITSQQMLWERMIQGLQMADKGQEDDDVLLWTTYESGMESDISSEYDRYSSSLGLITVM